jgi:hypothetical protein
VSVWSLCGAWRIVRETIFAHRRVGRVGLVAGVGRGGNLGMWECPRVCGRVSVHFVFPSVCWVVVAGVGVCSSVYLVVDVGWVGGVPCVGYWSRWVPVRSCVRGLPSGGLLGCGVGTGVCGGVGGWGVEAVSERDPGVFHLSASAVYCVSMVRAWASWLWSFCHSGWDTRKVV